jgi:hypothetical protein
MGGVLKTLFFIMVVYYSIRVILRIIAPFLIKYLFKKAQNSTFSNQNNNQRPPQEGKVHVSKSNEKPSTKKNVGEYIDFEEVDEND